MRNLYLRFFHSSSSGKELKGTEIFLSKDQDISDFNGEKVVSLRDMFNKVFHTPIFASFL